MVTTCCWLCLRLLEHLWYAHDMLRDFLCCFGMQYVHIRLITSLLVSAVTMIEHVCLCWTSVQQEPCKPEFLNSWIQECMCVKTPPGLLVVWHLPVCSYGGEGRCPTTCNPGGVITHMHSWIQEFRNSGFPMVYTWRVVVGWAYMLPVCVRVCNMYLAFLKSRIRECSWVLTPPCLYLWGVVSYYM